MPSKYSECKSPVISATGLSAIDRCMRLTASKVFFLSVSRSDPSFSRAYPPSNARRILKSSRNLRHRGGCSQHTGLSLTILASEQMTFVPPTVPQFFTALFQLIYTLSWPPTSTAQPKNRFHCETGLGKQTQLLGSIVVERALKQVVFGCSSVL